MEIWNVLGFSDTLVKLMEYGDDEDDDDEETNEESPNNNSGPVTARKPFWAFWVTN